MFFSFADFNLTPMVGAAIIHIVQKRNPDSKRGDSFSEFTQMIRARAGI